MVATDNQDNENNKQQKTDAFGNVIADRTIIRKQQKLCFKPDEAYRGILKHPELLLDFLQTIKLPHIPLEGLSVEDITDKDTAILGAEHGQESSDLFFSLSVKNKDTAEIEKSYLFLCIEHQSSNDPKMPIRVTSYVFGKMVSLIADKSNKLQSSKGLPLIWPIVLFTDCDSKWTAPLDVLSYMDQEQLKQYPMLKRFYSDAPVYDLVSIQDLNHQSLEQMDTLFSMIVLLETTKNTSKYYQVQERLICRIVDLQKINPSLARFVQQWYYYFEAKQLSQTKAAMGKEIQVVEAEQLSAEELSQYVTKGVKTTYQRFKDEGIEQGVEQGAQLVRLATLKELFEEHYGQEGSVYWQEHFANQTISDDT